MILFTLSLSLSLFLFFVSSNQIMKGIVVLPSLCILSDFFCNVFFKLILFHVQNAHMQIDFIWSKLKKEQPNLKNLFLFILLK